MLKKLINKIEDALGKLACKVAESEAVQEERGDTNFISILIILGVVIILAGVFMGFKDQIIGQVQEIIDGFTIG